MAEPGIRQIIEDVLDDQISADQATEALEHLITAALAPYTIEHAAGYHAPVGTMGAGGWKQVWPPLQVWCQQNGGHCASGGGASTTCKHCGALMVP